MNTFNLGLLLMLISIANLFGNGEERIYTVIAPSGLSLRSGPGLETERIMVIPFGEQVIIDKEEGGLFTQERETTIDKRQGYWLPIIYGTQKGFLFSGYLKNGYLLVPETEINDVFRIVVPGVRCDPLNYDPNWHWYGWQLNERKDKFEITEVSPKVSFQLEFEEEDEEFMHAAPADYLELSTGLDKRATLLIGSKESLDLQNLMNGMSYFTKGEQYLGTFGKAIYPYENYQLPIDDQNQYYTFSGEEQIDIVENYKGEAAVQRMYQLYLTVYKRDIKSNRLNITRLINPTELQYINENNGYFVRQHPRLLWSGDLNNDAVLDFIFYRPNYYESCGGNEAYFIIKSSVNEGVIEYKKAAMDIINSCFGC